ncbi:tetratricopeptide repeat protein [Bacteroidota bacterium]
MQKKVIIIGLVVIFGLAVKSQAQVGSSDYQYALIEAVKQKNLGNISGAIELYKMVLAESDSVAIAHYELGTLYLIVKKPILAEDQFQRAYELDKSNEWFINGYIDALVIREKYSEANDLIRTILLSTDDPLEYRFKKANIFFLAGKGRKAVKILNKIEKDHGVSDKVILLKANIFEDEGKLNAARKEIDKLIEFFPESLQFLVVAAELAMKNKQSDLANQYYSEVLEIDSTNIYALTNLTDYYREKGEHEKSLYYLKKSFKSDFIEYDRKMAILSYYLTDQYFLENYSDELGELINVILIKHQDKPEIKLYAVDFFIQHRDYQNAFNTMLPLLNDEIKDYEIWRQGILLANALSENKELLRLTKDAIAIFPDSSEIIYFKGIAEYENEMYEDLIQTYSDEKIKQHDNPELVSQTKQIIAEAYQKLKLYEQADSLFRSIIKEEPKNYLVINNFCYYLALRGESLDEARRLSYQTIVENPENGTFLDTYAWVLYRIGAYQEAEKYINKALQKGGLNDPDVNEHAAEIHLKLKSYHVAKSFYEKAIILGGDKEKLTEKINYLVTLYEK